MKKIILVLIAIVFLSFNYADSVSADSVVVGESAKLLNTYENDNYDYRVVILKKYLDKHNSPLASASDDFIRNADKYNLDWRIVPAISGVESTFGKNIPINSYNAYGWNNGNYYFESWDDSIEVVSKTLREKYLDNGANSLNKIARRYAPPSPDWSWKVRWFMNEIDPIPLTFTL